MTKADLINNLGTISAQTSSGLAMEGFAGFAADISMIGQFGVKVLFQPIWWLRKRPSSPNITMMSSSAWESSAGGNLHSED